MLEAKTYIIFFKYAIPSILGLLSISSAVIIDGYFIGNYVGAVGLAAINISHPFSSILFGLGLMFTVGNSVMAGKLMGEKKIEEASNIFSKSVIFIFMLAIILSLILHFYLSFILDILNVQKELKAYTLDYLPIILSFLPFFMTAIVVDYFVRVDENPNLSFIACLVSAVANIVLDYLFIVKFDWGISGAAYATGISQLLIIFVLIPHFFLKRATIKLVKPKGSFASVIQASKNGLSEFVNESSIGITVLIFNYFMLKNFGAVGVASYTIIGYFIMTSVMISFAIADSMQPVISKNFGAQYFNRIKSFLRFGFSSILVIEILITFLGIFTPETLVNIFIEDKDIKTKEITLEFISYAWPAFLFSGLNIMITSYLTSMQKAKYSAIIAILRSLIFPVFFIFMLPLIFGQKGIFMALAVSELITFIIAIYLFIKNNPSAMAKKSKV